MLLSIRRAQDGPITKDGTIPNGNRAEAENSVTCGCIVSPRGPEGSDGGESCPHVGCPPLSSPYTPSRW